MSERDKIAKAAILLREKGVDIQALDRTAEVACMNAEQMIDKAAASVLPHATALTMALCEQAMAKGLETAADTLRALADDIIAGRAPVSDIREAADYLTRIATKKRQEAAKVLNRN